MKNEKKWIIIVLFVMLLNNFLPVVSLAETMVSEESAVSLTQAAAETSLESTSIENIQSTESREASKGGDEAVHSMIATSESSMEQLTESSIKYEAKEERKESGGQETIQSINPITGVNLTDVKGQEYNTTTNRPQRQAPLKLELQVGGSNQTIEAGTYFYQLPSDIAISNNVSGYLQTVGTWNLSTNGNLTIVFNETVVNGDYKIDIETSFIPYDDNSDLYKEIIFSLANNQEKKYKLLFKFSGESILSLKKNKQFNADVVTTELKTNINRETIEPNAKIVTKTTISNEEANVTESEDACVKIGNIKVFEQDVSMGGNLIGDPVLFDLSEYTVTQTNATLEVTLNKETNKAVILTYETAINDQLILNEELTYLKTDATVYNQSLSKYIYFNYNHNPHVTKKGIYNVKNNTITWTIDYNLDNRELAKGTKLTDIIEDSVDNDLIFSNLKIYYLNVYGTNSISQGGYASASHWDTSQFGQYTTDFIYTNPQTLPATNAYRIVYETAIKNPSPREIKSKVSDPLDSAEAEVNLAPANISKILEEDSLNLTDGVVDWSIIINEKHWGIGYNQIIDTFGNRVKEIVDDSINFYYYVKGDSKTKHPLVSGVDYTLVKESHGFTVMMLGEHKEITTNKYVLTYTTKFDNTNIKKGDVLENKVSLGGEGDLPMEASASFDIPEFLASGGKKNVEYDSNKGIFTWTIGINEEHYNYDKLILTDEIETIQKLEKDSIEILELNKIVQEDGRETILTGEAITSSDPRYPTVVELKDNRIYLEFAALGNKKVAVRYKTTPNKAPFSGYFTIFKNVATISNNNEYIHQLKAEKTVTLGINPYKVGRLSTQDNKLANWLVKTNIMPENQPYKNLVLEDSFTLADFSKAEHTNFVIGKDAFIVKDLITEKELVLGEDYELSFTYDANDSPAGTMIKNYETNYFKIVFKKKTRGVSVEYKTLTTKSSNLMNTAAFSDGAIKSSDWNLINHTITSGSGSGKGIGQIPLLKVDQETREPLQGAVFELFDKESQQSLGLKITSDQDGKVDFHSIAEGEYLVKETKPPKGYKLSKKYQEGVILKTKSEEQMGEVDYETVVENEKIPTTGVLELKKVDQDGNPLAAAEFIVSRTNNQQTEYYQGDSGWTVDSQEAKIVTSNNQGFIQLSNMEAGSYEFIEVKAPLGYQLDSTPVPLKLTKEMIETSTKATAEKSNFLQTGRLQIKKIDKETKQPLAGAIFTLTSKDSSVADVTITTNDNGIAVFDKLQQGLYTVTETQAPIGYHKLEQPLQVAIVAAQLSKELTIENEPIIGEIIIKHVDTNGNNISEDQVLKNRVGQTQYLSPKNIDGYKFKERQKIEPMVRDINPIASTDMVTFLEEPQTIIYIYEKNDLQVKETDKIIPSKKETALVSAMAKKNLPRTNELMSQQYQVFGYMILFLLLSGNLMYFLKKIK